MRTKIAYRKMTEYVSTFIVIVLKKEKNSVNNQRKPLY